MSAEYRRRAWRLYRAWLRGQIPTRLYAWLSLTLREQYSAWRWN